MKAAKDAITFQRYKLPVSLSEMDDVLRVCYEFDVKSRGHEPVMDARVQSVIAKVSRWLVDTNTKPSLLLYGGIGNGKTTVARAIHRAISGLYTTAKNNAVIEGNIERGDPLTKYTKPTYISAQQIVDNVLSDEDKARCLLKNDLIIIDDLGCEPVSAKVFGTELTPIVEILRSRYESMKSTVITTNLDLNGIEKTYGARILDRIIETFELIAFENKSYRK